MEGGKDNQIWATLGMWHINVSIYDCRAGSNNRLAFKLLQIQTKEAKKEKNRRCIGNKKMKKEGKIGHSGAIMFTGC